MVEIAAISIWVSSPRIIYISEAYFQREMLCSVWINDHVHNQQAKDSIRDVISKLTIVDFYQGKEIITTKDGGEMAKKKVAKKKGSKKK